MGTPFLGEIRLMSSLAFGSPSSGWAVCDGQVLQIVQYQALFALLGTTYGGNGTTTFALSDLRGRVPIHMGSQSVLGQRGGEESHALTTSEMSAHQHPLTATTAAADSVDPTNKLLAQPASAIYAAPGTPSAMKSTLINPTGGSQPHENRMPYLTLTFCIALQGLFPSRD